METDNPGQRRFDGLIAAAEERASEGKRLGSYHVSPLAVAVVVVTAKGVSMVPVCHGHLVSIATMLKAARRRGSLSVVRRSRRDRTSRRGSSGHLCPVVCLGYPLLPLHPLPRAFDHAFPSLALRRVTSSRSSRIDNHQRKSPRVRL